MSGADGTPPEDGVVRRAAAHLVNLLSEEPTAEEESAFIDWLRASPHHVSEFLRMVEIHGHLELFDRWVEAGHGAAPSPGAETVPVATAGAVVRPARGNARGVLAAGVVLLVLSSAMLWWRYAQTRFATASAQHREITLSDGSMVAMAPNSAIHVRYSSRERAVVLDRGEAVFFVAKHSGRPFKVSAANTVVSATGTTFDVHLKADDVAVTVVEGTVRVDIDGGSRARAPRAAAAGRPTSLSENQQVIVSVPTGLATAPRLVDGREVVAWVEGRFAFENEPVSAVVATFNRFNEIQIGITDPRIAGKLVSGSFRIGDPEAFAAFLASVEGVRVVEQGPTRMLLLEQSLAEDRTPGHQPDDPPHSSQRQFPAER